MGTTENVLQKQKYEKHILDNEKIINEYKMIKEKHKLEIEATKADLTKLKDENSRSLRLKEEEIEKLETEILKEKQIVAQIQLTQEKEILEKEGEIRILNTILTQERKILLEKEAEVEKLKSFRIPFQECGVLMESSQPAPARPPRTKSLVVTTKMQEQANIPIDNDDNSDTVTFHDALNNELSDALSDEEDVVIEDLELDEE